jgi:methyl-accepting chemotaxis protein
MAKSNSRVVNWRIWAPVAAGMRHLRFPAKMALISVAFLLPVAWLLAGFVASARSDINSVAEERVGVRYAQAVYRTLEASDAWRFATRSAAYGDSGMPVDATRKAFEDQLAALRQLQAASASHWNLAEPWTRIDQSLALVQKLKPDDTRAIYEQMNALSNALSALLAESTDLSGLALDPELGSYYLMSATLMRGSDVIRSTGELRGLAGEALRAGRIEPQNLAHMSELRAIVAHELNLAKGELQKVKAAQPEAARSLIGEALAATVDMDQRLAQLFPPGATEVQGDVKAFLAQANQTLATQYRQVLGNLEVLDALLAERESGLLRAFWISLAITAISLLSAFYLAMGFYRAMFGGFKTLRRHLMAISMSDLRLPILIKGKDEVADLLREVGYMQASLRETVQQVQGASDSVVQASLEIATGTRDLSARTESAAAALEESSAALEETTASVGHTAESAKQASLIAQDNAVVAERGGLAMGQVVQTMERIQASSRRINDIIGVIDSIAFQTNILALNAAVEAARAGEQGRGFAVVASEVRNLAQRSADAAKEIKTLISASVSEVDSGMGVVRKAGDTMGEIVVHAANVRQLLEEVAGGTREQSMGMGQIGQAVQDLDQNTQANATLVEQTATAAAAQRKAAVRMAAQVDEFRLPSVGQVQPTLVEGVNVDGFIDAHRQWKVKLRDAIENRDKVDAATLSRDDCCALGKWIYGDGQSLASRQSFTDLVGHHRQFHRVAGEVATLVNQRSYRAAEEALAPNTPFAAATSEVVLVLSTAKRLGF